MKNIKTFEEAIRGLDEHTFYLYDKIMPYIKKHRDFSNNYMQNRLKIVEEINEISPVKLFIKAHFAPYTQGEIHIIINFGSIKYSDKGGLLTIYGLNQVKFGESFNGVKCNIDKNGINSDEYYKLNVDDLDDAFQEYKMQKGSFKNYLLKDNFYMQMDAKKYNL